MIHSFLFFFVLSATFFILLNQNQLNAFAVFTVNRNDNNEDSDSIAKIILTKIKYRSDRFSDDIAGQIKNVGNGTAESIQIIFSYYDKKGEVIGSDYVYANQDFLKPGQKSPFSQMVDEEIGDDMKAYEVSLSWQNSDGLEEYAENVQVEDESNYMIDSGELSKVLSDEEIEKLGLFER
jgi:hypothetical protein